MSVVETSPLAGIDALRELLSRGWGDASDVPAPEVRAEHQHAWLLRAALIDPELAVRWLAEVDADASVRARVLSERAARRLAEASPETGPAWSEAVAALRAVPETGLRLELFNDLCEAAIRAAERDPGEALARLRELRPLLDDLEEGDEEAATSRALGLALMGEALAVLDDPEGAPLLERAVSESDALPAREHVLTFAVQSLAGRQPDRARELAARLTDPYSRFEARLNLLRRHGSAAADLLPDVRADAALLEESRQPEALARLGAVVGLFDPAAARALYGKAAELLAEMAPQLRALHLAGIATSASAWNEALGSELYEEAVRAVRSEPERVRQVVALAAIAYQVGERQPELAQALLEESFRGALSLEANWEIAHALEILLDARRPAGLDLSGAQPLLEAALARVGEDDLRLPGVLGLPEIGRGMLQVNPRRAAQLFEEWLERAAATGDAEGMVHASLSLFTLDREAGRRALIGAARQLAERADCFSLTQFCWTAGEAAPDATRVIALAIPESRERTRALGALAAVAWTTDPAEAGLHIALLSDPEERSVARLRIVDRTAGTDDLPRPAAPSEVNICCSLIPQMDPAEADRLVEELRALEVGE